MGYLHHPYVGGFIHPWVVSPDLGTHQPEKYRFTSTAGLINPIQGTRMSMCSQSPGGRVFWTLFESLGIGGVSGVKNDGTKSILESVNIEKNNIMLYTDIYVDLRKKIREIVVKKYIKSLS